jgi:hypothetical protein
MNSTGLIDFDSTMDTVFDELAKCVNADEWLIEFFAASRTTSVRLGAGVGLSIAFAMLVLGNTL